MKNLNQLKDNILYQIFKIFWVHYQKHQKVTDNPPIKIYVNKIEDRITFKIKIGYYLEPLIRETMKLLGGTKSKIAKNENGQNVQNLEITEVVLV